MPNSDPAPASTLTPRIRWGWDFGDDFSAIEAARFHRLLYAIRDSGTLVSASREAGISYRAAWGLLRKYEMLSGNVLVMKARGKGSQLSALAERMLELDEAARMGLAQAHAPWEFRLHGLLSQAVAETSERLKISASHDLALGDWIEHGRHIQIDIHWRGSEEALSSLARGECDVAGFHLPDDWTLPQSRAWLSQWLKPKQYLCYPLMRRQHGLLTASGNPFQVNSLLDVAQLRLKMVNRQRGSGTRSMIDQLLAANSLRAGDIQGYAHEEFTHEAVAAMIASGQADVGIGIEAAAARYDLGFIPLAWDRYCLAIHVGTAYGSAVSHLLRRFQGETFHQRLKAMKGYDKCPNGPLIPWESLFSPGPYSEGF